MLKNAKVLVAGGTGFIGVNLIQRLLSLGCQVRATLHKRPAVIDSSAIEYVHADLTSLEDCHGVAEGVDYVFMLSACTAGAAVMAKTPLVQVTPNVVMNAQMLEAAYQAKVKKFLFVSSSAAYPPTGDRPVTEPEMFDGDPYEVYYSVGWMKRYAEILCKIYAQKIKNPMPTVIVRPSNIYGPYDKFDFGTSHVTAALIRRVVERQNPFEVWGTGKDVRDLIYIDDFLDGMLLAFEKTEVHAAINIASGVGHSIEQILQTILEVDGYTDADLRFDPSKPTTIPVRLIDTTLAKESLGFQPQISLREGLRRTIEWYRDRASVWTK